MVAVVCILENLYLSPVLVNRGPPLQACRILRTRAAVQFLYRKLLVQQLYYGHISCQSDMSWPAYIEDRTHGQPGHRML